MTHAHLSSQKSVQRRLERVLLAFFGGCALFAVVLYLVAPSIYTQGLLSSSDPAERYPWPATLALIVLVMGIAVLIIGVLRHLRWLFWLLLLAFSCSLLEIPATVLQWAGFLPAFPAAFPLWYSLCRMGVALIEGGIAVWMLSIYRRYGVWGRGRPEETGKDEGTQLVRERFDKKIKSAKLQEESN